MLDFSVVPNRTPTRHSRKSKWPNKDRILQRWREGKNHYARVTVKLTFIWITIKQKFYIIIFILQSVHKISWFERFFCCVGSNSSSKKHKVCTYTFSVFSKILLTILVSTHYWQWIFPIFPFAKRSCNKNQVLKSSQWIFLSLKARQESEKERKRGWIRTKLNKMFRST